MQDEDAKDERRERLGKAERTHGRGAGRGDTDGEQPVGQGGGGQPQPGDQRKTGGLLERGRVDDHPRHQRNGSQQQRQGGHGRQGDARVVGGQLLRVHGVQAVADAGDGGRQQAEGVDAAAGGREEQRAAGHSGGGGDQPCPGQVFTVDGSGDEARGDGSDAQGDDGGQRGARVRGGIEEGRLEDGRGRGAYQQGPGHALPQSGEQGPQMAALQSAQYRSADQQSPASEGGGSHGDVGQSLCGSDGAPQQCGSEDQTGTRGESMFLLPHEVIE
nr:hypothetical protein [Streptomyces aurantiacus]